MPQFIRSWSPSIFLVMLTLSCASAYDGVPPVHTSPIRLHRILVDGKWGFIDSAGDIVIAPQFQWADDFSDGLAQVRLGVQHGYIDTTGRIVIELPPTPDKRPFSEGFAIAWRETGYTFLDRMGLVLDCRFEEVKPFSQGLAAVCVDPGRRQRPKENGANWTVANGGKWGFVDKTGELVIPAVYTAVGHFTNGLAPVYVGGWECGCTGLHDGAWGYINREGKMVVEPQFRQAGNFSEGLAVVTYDGQRYAWIDENGKFAIELRPLSFAASFREGVARIRGTRGGTPGWNDSGYITKAGEVFAHSSFPACGSELSEGLFQARGPTTRDGPTGRELPPLHGYCDRQGNWIIKPQFTHSQPFRGGLAGVQKEGKMLYINKRGETIWPR